MGGLLFGYTRDIMNQDDLFRWLMIAGLVITLAIALPYRVKSQATREPLDRRQEGLFILATLRPVGAVLWLGAFAYMIKPTWLGWSSGAVPVSVRWTRAGGGQRVRAWWARGRHVPPGGVSPKPPAAPRRVRRRGRGRLLRRRDLRVRRRRPPDSPARG